MLVQYHVLTALRILTKPSLLIPHLTVPSIASVDWPKLREKGFEGIVVDRDNCLTRPRQDDLIPSLRDSWSSLLKSFPSRVLIVSNSAGTEKDAAFLQVETLSRNLGVPVLIHRAPKPFCTRAVLNHFAALRASPSSPSDSAPAPPRLIVVGDRLSTDVLLASRLPRALSIWTTKVWEEESLGVRLARFAEGSLLQLARRGKGAEAELGGEGIVLKELKEEEREREGWMGWMRRAGGRLWPGSRETSR